MKNIKILISFGLFSIILHYSAGTKIHTAANKIIEEQNKAVEALEKGK